MLFGFKWIFFIFTFPDENRLLDRRRGHDIQYTNSSPPPAVDIPNVLTNPVEDIPVQANAPRNDEQYNYPIIIASPTEIVTDNQPAINTHSIDHTDVQSPTRSRLRLEIKRPKYLDDYVLQ